MTVSEAVKVAIKQSYPLVDLAASIINAVVGILASYPLL